MTAITHAADGPVVKVSENQCQSCMPLGASIAFPGNRKRDGARPWIAGLQHLHAACKRGAFQ